MAMRLVGLILLSAFTLQLRGGGHRHRHKKDGGGGRVVVVQSFTWLAPVSAPKRSPRRPTRSLSLLAIAVPASQLEQDLNDAEKTVVAVVRQSRPSVAYVTSVWPVLRNDDADDQRCCWGQSTLRQRRRRNGNNVPLGQRLGSGSGFVVDERGYVVTNYHVIEQAYRIQSMALRYDSFVDQIAGNLTAWADPSSRDLVNRTVQALLRLPTATTTTTTLPQIYVRIDSATNYQKCRIVDVKPDLDVAVLKIEGSDNCNETKYAAMPFGSSANLLVGQSLIAIGNPFGLDNTVTTGVVSALDRELQTTMTGGRTSPTLRNCIQTDCAINPGNSGGPLLNLKGEVVGVNTAIVSTSGSSAGIGFAVPSDPVQPFVAHAIRRDGRPSLVPPRPTTRAWLGVSILKGTSQNWVANVTPNSPAAMAGIQALRRGVDDGDSSDRTKVVQWGDAIVAVGGNSVETYAELQAELRTRAVGEQLALTLENGVTGDKRVVYLTLQAAPNSS